MLLSTLDDTEELCDQALLRITAKKSTIDFFEEGDLILHKVYDNTKECNNKMGAKWERPYQIAKVVKPGVYKFITMSDEQIIHPWNSINLKR